MRQQTFPLSGNGYEHGGPFHRERVEIFHKLAFDYLNGLDYGLRQKKALVNMLDKAMGFSSLNFGFEYKKLMEIFGVGCRTTVSAWLKEFEQDNILLYQKRHPQPSTGFTISAYAAGILL